MKTLGVLPIAGKGKRIVLCQGDLTELGTTDRFDVLIVSAFPGNYWPSPESLIGALNRKGLDLHQLAKDKQLDLREAFSCWLSKPFGKQHPDLHFDRILCFEPLTNGKPPEVVGDIFQALPPILAEHDDIRSVAMPLVATGSHGYSIADMLEPLLDAAIHWMRVGLPLDELKIVAYTEEQARQAWAVFEPYLDKLDSAPAPVEPELADVSAIAAVRDLLQVDKLVNSEGLSSAKAAAQALSAVDMGAVMGAVLGYELPDRSVDKVVPPAPQSIPKMREQPPPAAPSDSRPINTSNEAAETPGYDVFISYAHENAAVAQAFEQFLLQAKPDIQIFLDRKSLDVGCAWQVEIFESLDYCRRVVAFYSPDYIQSKVCKEEFNIAWARGREMDQDILFPIYAYSAKLPTYMKARNYLDCREGDQAKLQEAAQRLLQVLEADG